MPMLRPLVKKNLVEEFGNADATIVGSVLDFVTVSPAKEPVYGCRCRGYANRTKLM